jgi:hypothetical protein
MEPMLDGWLQTKRNKVVNKDGTEHTSPEHYQCQYRGPDGRQRRKSIPRRHCGEVRRMIARGREYRRIEREYTTLFTEYTLANVGNKRPAPWPESFSCFVSGETIDKFIPLMKRHGLARDSGTAPRMQCVADGEPALEDALRHLLYLESRKENMRYGWLRKDGPLPSHRSSRLFSRRDAETLCYKCFMNKILIKYRESICVSARERI